VIQTEDEVSVREVSWTHRLARNVAALFTEFSAPALDAGQQEIDKPVARMLCMRNTLA